MAVTTRTTYDVATVLVAALAPVQGLRVEWFISDKSRPPVCIIGQPTIDWMDPDSGFCWATWEFPLLIVTTRASDRDAQGDLSRFVCEVANALDTFPTAGTGVEWIAAMNARPDVATIGGQELPAYNLRVQVRA